MECPKCFHSHARQINYRGIECCVCPKCSYDERDQYDESAGEKTNQKAKGNFSPYKTGGPKRVK